MFGSGRVVVSFPGTGIFTIAMRLLGERFSDIVTVYTRGTDSIGRGASLFLTPYQYEFLWRVAPGLVDRSVSVVVVRPPGGESSGSGVVGRCLERLSLLAREHLNVHATSSVGEVAKGLAGRCKARLSLDGRSLETLLPEYCLVNWERIRSRRWWIPKQAVEFAALVLGSILVAKSIPALPLPGLAREALQGSLPGLQLISLSDIRSDAVTLVDKIMEWVQAPARHARLQERLYSESVHSLERIERKKGLPPLTLASFNYYYSARLQQVHRELWARVHENRRVLEEVRRQLTTILVRLAGTLMPGETAQIMWGLTVTPLEPRRLAGMIKEELNVRLGTHPAGTVVNAESMRLTGGPRVWGGRGRVVLVYNPDRLVRLLAVWKLVGTRQGADERLGLVSRTLDGSVRIDQSIGEGFNGVMVEDADTVLVRVVTLALSMKAAIVAPVSGGVRTRLYEALLNSREVSVVCAHARPPESVPPRLRALATRKFYCPGAGIVETFLPSEYARLQESVEETGVRHPYSPVARNILQSIGIIGGDMG